MCTHNLFLSKNRNNIKLLHLKLSYLQHLTSAAYCIGMFDKVFIEEMVEIKGISIYLSRLMKLILIECFIINKQFLINFRLKFRYMIQTFKYHCMIYYM